MNTLNLKALCLLYQYLCWDCNIVETGILRTVLEIKSVLVRPLERIKKVVTMINVLLTGSGKILIEHKQSITKRKLIQLLRSFHVWPTHLRQKLRI